MPEHPCSSAPALRAASPAPCFRPSPPTPPRSSHPRYRCMGRARAWSYATCCASTVPRRPTAPSPASFSVASPSARCASERPCGERPSPDVASLTAPAARLPRPCRARPSPACTRSPLPCILCTSPTSSAPSTLTPRRPCQTSRTKSMSDTHGSSTPGERRAGTQPHRRWPYDRRQPALVSQRTPRLSHLCRTASIRKLPINSAPPAPPRYARCCPQRPRGRCGRGRQVAPPERDCGDLRGGPHRPGTVRGHPLRERPRGGDHGQHGRAEVLRGQCHLWHRRRSRLQGVAGTGRQLHFSPHHHHRRALWRGIRRGRASGPAAVEDVSPVSPPGWHRSTHCCARCPSCHRSGPTHPAKPSALFSPSQSQSAARRPAAGADDSGGAAQHACGRAWPHGPNGGVPGKEGATGGDMPRASLQDRGGRPEPAGGGGGRPGHPRAALYGRLVVARWRDAPTALPAALGARQPRPAPAPSGGDGGPRGGGGLTRACQVLGTSAHARVGPGGCGRG